MKQTIKIENWNDFPIKKIEQEISNKNNQTKLPDKTTDKPPTKKIDEIKTKKFKAE